MRARALAARGEDVALFEESERPGGVVRTETRGGYLLELGPTTVRPTPELWRLVEELGLEGEALFADPSAPRYVEFGGRLHPLPASPGSFVTSGLLSTLGKLRLLAEPFVRKGDPSHETVREFVVRRFGREAAERLVEPFVSGIWGGRSDQLAVEEAFPALARWENEGGSILRGALGSGRKRGDPSRAAGRGLLSFRDGLETLPRRLAAELGARPRWGTAVRSVRPSAGGWTLSTVSGDVAAGRVHVATPAGAAAQLVSTFAPEAAAALSEIPHAPLAVVHLASTARAPRKGFGHLVVPQPARRIVGAIWASSLFPGRAPDGRALFTVFLGGARDPSAVGLSDPELVALASRDLAAALGIPEAFDAILVTRYARAIPQYDLGHRDRMAVLAETEKRFRGLAFVGSYRGGISVGDVVRNALSIP